jgi:hypothetical protein
MRGRFPSGHIRRNTKTDAVTRRLHTREGRGRRVPPLPSPSSNLTKGGKKGRVFKHPLEDFTMGWRALCFFRSLSLSLYVSLFLLLSLSCLAFLTLVLSCLAFNVSSKEESVMSCLVLSCIDLPLFCMALPQLSFSLSLPSSFSLVCLLVCLVDCIHAYIPPLCSSSSTNRSLQDTDVYTDQDTDQDTD